MARKNSKTGTKKSPLDSLERKVIENPSLSRLNFQEGGIFNEGFDSLPHLNISPSFFYIADNDNWMDNNPYSSLQRINHHPRTFDASSGQNKSRFTESWIELDRAYSCGSSTSFGRKKKCFSSSSNSSSSFSGCCQNSGFCTKFFRSLIYILIAFTVIGFAAIISGILYMEIFHKYDSENVPYLYKMDDNVSRNVSKNFESQNFGPNFNATNFVNVSKISKNESSIDTLIDTLNVSKEPELYDNGNNIQSMVPVTTTKVPLLSTSVVPSTVSSTTLATRSGTTRNAIVDAKAIVDTITTLGMKSTMTTTQLPPTTVTVFPVTRVTTNEPLIGRQGSDAKVVPVTVPKLATTLKATIFDTTTQSTPTTTAAMTSSFSFGGSTRSVTPLVTSGRDWSRRNPPTTTTIVTRTPTTITPRTPTTIVPRTPTTITPRTPTTIVPRTPTTIVPRTPTTSVSRNLDTLRTTSDISRTNPPIDIRSSE